MLNRTSNILQLHTKVITRSALVRRRLRLSTSSIRPANKDVDVKLPHIKHADSAQPPKDPIEKRDTDVLPMTLHF